MNNVQEKDESQVDGGKVDEKTGDEEVQLPFEVKGEEDLEKLFDEHPKFRDEFEADPKAFIEKYGESEKGKKDEEVQEEDWLAADPVPGGDDGKSKDDGKDKGGDDSEARAQLETRLGETTDKLNNVLKEVEELKKGKTAKEKKEIDTELKDVDLSGLAEFSVDDVDLFSDEGQVAAKKQIAALSKAVKDVAKVATAYKARLDEIDTTVKTGINSVKEDVGTVKEDVGSIKNRASSDDHIASEFKALDALVKNQKEIFGEKVRPVKAIEDDYLETITDMMQKVVRTDAPLLKNGRFSPEASKVLELATSSTEKAKRFQVKCDEMGIGFSEDLDVLKKVYEIRGIRDELSARDEAGNIIKAAEYDRVIENYLGRHMNEYRVKDRLGERSAEERAVVKRKKFAPETKASTAPEDEDISKMPKKEVERILKKTPIERTPQERETAYNILVSVGTEEEEARDLSGIDIKEEKE